MQEDKEVQRLAQEVMKHVADVRRRMMSKRIRYGKAVKKQKSTEEGK
jgi:hypothetical protein